MRQLLKIQFPRRAALLYIHILRREISLNRVDLIIIIVVAIFALIGYRKGLVQTAYRLISFFAAMFIAWQLYPHVARFLRGTALFPAVQNMISNALNLDEFIYDHAQARGAAIIDALPLPSAVQQLLHTNNTPAMFEVLQVSTIEEYISGFFANIVINGIAILAVYLLTLLALTIVGGMLDIVTRLPVINTLNRIGGFLFGLILGGIIVWVGLIAVVLFAAGSNPEWFAMLEASAVAQWMLRTSLPQLASVS